MPEFYVLVEEILVKRSMKLVRADDEEQARQGEGAELVLFPGKITNVASEQVIGVLPFEEPK